MTLGIAESCTGGLVSHRLTNIPGSSHFLKVGIIAYSNEAKKRLLGVKAHLLRNFGAVSAEVAQAMAKGIQNKFKCDFGIGITGIAGPTGATQTKPVGLVYIAASCGTKTIIKKFLLKGNRLSVKSQAATNALKLLLKLL